MLALAALPTVNTTAKLCRRRLHHAVVSAYWAPIDGLNGSRGGVRVKFATRGRFIFWISEALAGEVQAVGAMHEPVENGVGHRRV